MTNWKIPFPDVFDGFNQAVVNIPDDGGQNEDRFGKVEVLKTDLAASRGL
jgi:hypothetical protein